MIILKYKHLKQISMNFVKLKEHSLIRDRRRNQISSALMEELQRLQIRICQFLACKK